MNPQEILERGVEWIVGALALGAAAAFVMGHVQHRRGHWHRHVRRLSAEIIEVAESIQIDLQALPRTSDIADLARRCNECRARAEEAFGRRMTSQDALEEAIGQLHDDHRRVVDLRSELDAHIAHKRGGAPVVRACKVATGSKPSRSRWATTSLHTSSSFG